MTNSHDKPESSRHIAGQFLMFAGMLVTIGGSLALIRTGERSIFYTLLMPIGLGMWALGYWLRRR